MWLIQGIKPVGACNEILERGMKRVCWALRYLGVDK